MLRNNSVNDRSQLGWGRNDVGKAESGKTDEIRHSHVTRPGDGSVSTSLSERAVSMLKGAISSFCAYLVDLNGLKDKSSDPPPFSAAKSNTPTTGSSKFNQVAVQHHLGVAQTIHSFDGQDSSAMSLALKNLVGRDLHASDTRLVDGDITCTIPSRDGAREKTVTLPNPERITDSSSKEDMFSKLKSGTGEFSGSADLDRALLKEIGLMQRKSTSELSADQVAHAYGSVHEQMLTAVEKDITRLKATDLKSGNFGVKLGGETQLHFATKNEILPTKLLEIKGTFHAKVKGSDGVQGFSIMKRSDQLYIKGSQGMFSKSGYMRLPRAEELLTARDVREVKRNLSPEAYKQLLRNVSKDLTASDDKMLKWAKRLDRWKTNGPISRMVANALEKFVVNPNRLQTIIKAFAGEYNMLYKNIDGQLKEHPGGLTEIAQNIGAAAKDITSSAKTKALYVKSVINQFKSLETKIADANKKLGGACQDTVNLMAKTSDDIRQFQANFDPSSIGSDQDLKKLTTMLRECENRCQASIGKAIHVVSDELVPLLKSDASSGQVQNQDTSAKLNHIQSAQQKIAGLEKLYLMISSEMDTIRTSALNQTADIHISSNSEISTLTNETIDMPKTLQTVKSALTALTDPERSPKEKALIAHDALYGQFGVNSTLSEIAKASESLGGQTVNLLANIEGLDSIKKFLEECKAVLGAATDSTKLGDATMMGNLGSSRDPLMAKLSQKNAELEHYKTSLETSQSVKDELIKAGNMRVVDPKTQTPVKLSPHIDSILSDFNKASNSVFCEDSLTKLSEKPEQWGETSNRLLNVQDRIRGEMLRLIATPSSGEISEAKSKLIDTLQQASDKLDLLLDGHAKFPETMGVGIAGELDEARGESLSRYTLGQNAAIAVQESGNKDLITVFNKVVQFGRSDDLAKLEALANSRNVNDEVRAALKPFIEGEKTATKGKTDVEYIHKRTLQQLGSELSKASGSSVEVYAIRQDSSGSIHVTVNRHQKLEFGEQGTKVIVFSKTGMVREDTKRFIGLVSDSAEYAAFFEKLKTKAQNIETASLSSYDVGLSDPYSDRKGEIFQKLNDTAESFDDQLQDMACGKTSSLDSPYLQSKETFIQGMIAEFEKGVDTSLSATLLEIAKADIATQAEAAYTDMTARFNAAFKASMSPVVESRIDQFLADNFSKVNTSFTEFSEPTEQVEANKQWAKLCDMGREDIRQFVSDSFEPFRQIQNQGMLDEIKVMTESSVINNVVKLQYDEETTLNKMADNYMASPKFDGPKQVETAVLSTLKEIFPTVTFTISEAGELTPPTEPFKSESDLKTFQDKLEENIGRLVDKKMRANGDINVALAQSVKAKVFELAEQVADPKL